MYFRKMVGSKCYLSPINVDDYDKYTEWLNDGEITQYLNFAHMIISTESEKEILTILCKGHNYAIVDLSTDELIGNCGLLDHDQINQTAEIGIFIGRKEYLNRGYGREALSLLVDYSFNLLNLKNIILRVYAFNERAVRCYESVGFRTIGKRRGALTRNGKSHDVILMDIIPSEFNGI